MEKKAFFSAKNIAYLGVLLALVIVLQSVALVTGIFLPTSLSFVLIPIVLGAVMLGPLAGGVLGFMFGLVVVIFGVTGADKFTFYLFSQSPFLTFLTCMIKGIAAGVVPGFIYKALAKKNRYAGIVVASIAAPIMNTLFFVLGAMCMWGIFSDMAQANSQSVMYFIIVSCAAINFSIEFASTLIAAPAIYKVTEVIAGKKKGAKQTAKQEAPAQPEELTEVQDKP